MPTAEQSADQGVRLFQGPAADPSGSVPLSNVETRLVRTASPMLAAACWTTLVDHYCCLRRVRTEKSAEMTSELIRITPRLMGNVCLKGGSIRGGSLRSAGRVWSWSPLEVCLRTPREPD
jgi:hypothetical protein